MDAFRFPYDERELWYTGQYLRFEDRWFQWEQWTDGLRLFSSNLGPLPPGFTPVRDTTGPDSVRYGGYRDVDPSEVGESIWVRTECVWKNLPWRVLGSMPASRSWRLDLGPYRPDGYPVSRPCPTAADQARWPGLSALAKDMVRVDVSPSEVALVRTSVEPTNPATNREDECELRTAWWRESLRSSPWLPEVEGRAAGGRYLNVPNEGLELSRVRDGWRVAAAQGHTGVGVSASVVYVADDRVVMEAGIGESVDAASERLTEGLIARLQERPRIAAMGPVAVGDGPELL